jgi:hypothetical protein
MRLLIFLRHHRLQLLCFGFIISLGIGLGFYTLNLLTDTAGNLRVNLSFTWWQSLLSLFSLFLFLPIFLPPLIYNLLHPNTEPIGNPFQSVITILIPGLLLCLVYWYLLALLLSHLLSRFQPKRPF